MSGGTYHAEAMDPYCLPPGHAHALLDGAPWQRLAVLGDSVAEGLGDPADGYHHRPWADRLADALRRHRPDLAYLNLGRRGLLAAQVRERQLAPALVFAPDLAVVTCGGNDMFAPVFDEDAVAAEIDALVAALRARGTHVITMGLFDITRALPQAGAALRRHLHQLSRLTREVARRHAALHVDLTRHPASADPGIYSADRLHVNARGHAVAAAEVIRSLGAHLGNGAVPAMSGR
jgi:lysophospholipase L1-like esterase